MAVLTYVVATIAVGVIIRKYREWVWGRCKSTHSLKGKTFLITGANSGVGKETARQLLNRHATVIMGNRDEERTEKAIADIRATTKSGEIISHPLDLSSFQSIKKFAEIINKNYARIDVLINNAGVSVPLKDNLRTKENFELNFGVNHVGHFLLTKLLLEKVKESAPSRIVIVASTLHERGKIDFEDLNLDKLRATGKNPPLSPGYCNSKLANVYHGRELAERLKNDKVTVSMVCPGLTYTGLFRYSAVKWYHYIVFSPIAFWFLRTAHQGSQTIVFCATETDLPGKSGDFYRDCSVYKSKAKFDDVVQKKLWETSEQLVGK